MNINTQVDLTALLPVIETAIKAQFPGLKTVEFFRDDRDTIVVPACLLDLPEMEEAHEIDPGTGQLAVMARFEAELILGFRTAEAKLSGTVLAAAFAAFLHKARWPGGLTGPAESIHVYKSDFKPQLDQYEVWCVEWRQALHLGESVWTDEGIVPTTVYLGFAPDIGTGHEADYVQISP